VNLKYSVCYNIEALFGKRTKPDQQTQYVRYNRVFVKTVIVITEFVMTEFDCVDMWLEKMNAKVKNSIDFFYFRHSPALLRQVFRKRFTITM
jgi:hypothetical protein